jgi:hypothetical protein
VLNWNIASARLSVSEWHYKVGLFKPSAFASNVLDKSLVTPHLFLPVESKRTSLRDKHNTVENC